MPKEVYTPYENTANQAPVPDLQRRLPVAEDIARLKQDALGTLVKLPQEEWGSAYKALLGKYPGTVAYRKTIDICFESALRAANNLNAFWNEYEPGDSGVRDELTKLEIASPNAGKNMFEKMCLTTPQKGIKAMKGKFSLWFVTDRADFIDAYFNLHNAHSLIKREKKVDITANAFTCSPSEEFAFPVITMKSDLCKGIEFVEVFNHEAEHAQQAITREDKELRQVYGDDLFGKRMNRRLREPAPFYEIARRDLLAYFNYFGLFKPVSFNLEEVTAHVEDYGNCVKDEIMPGIYDNFYPKSIREYFPAERKEFIRRAHNGWNSLLGLHNQYRQEGVLEEGVNPARMTIDVMEQFPLKSWPAVVRLASSWQRS